MLRGRNYTKPFSLAGAFLGEIYMLYTVLAPYRKGPPGAILVPLPPEDALPAITSSPLGIFIFKLVACAIFFGVFGALVGLGIGLLVTGLLARRRQPSIPPN